MQMSGALPFRTRPENRTQWLLQTIPRPASLSSQPSHNSADTNRGIERKSVSFPTKGDKKRQRPWQAYSSRQICRIKEDYPDWYCPELHDERKYCRPLVRE